MNRRWLAGLMTLLLFVTLVTSAAAVTYLFQVEREVVNLFVLKDGTAAIEYTLDFLNDSGADAIDFVDIGMPNGWYEISSIQAEIDGKPITHVKPSEYVTPGVELGLGANAIQPGQRGQVHVTIGKVSNFLFKSTIEGKGDYASFNFTPNYFGSQYVKGKTNIEMNIILPEGLTTEQPVYYTPTNWPGNKDPESAIDDQNRVNYRWTTNNGNIASEYKFGGGFPASLVPAGVLQTEYQSGPSGSLSDWQGFACCAGIGVFIIAIFGLIIYGMTRSNKNRKMQYLPPKIAIEGHGIKRGLTAVEAAILQQEPLDKILTMILFGMLKKNAAQVVTQNPLELKVEATLPEDLRAYETQFLKAFQIPDKKGRQAMLQEMMVDLVQSVSQKMKGFSRKETLDYYKSITEKAWAYVQSAQTPNVKMEKYDEAMDWTMLDKDYDDKTRRMFGDGPVVVMPPRWWWRYDPGYRPASSTASSGGSAGTFGMPSHTPSTSSPSPAQGLPGASLAASMVNTVQNMSAGVIGDLNSFTGRVTNQTNPLPPPPTFTSSRGGGGGHSCACACACAGCACACAGGGR